MFPGSSLESAYFLLTQCQSCPISKQLKECFRSHLKYFTKKKIRSTFDHVHISVKPLRLGSLLAYLSYFPRSRWRWTVSSECLSDGLRCERSQSRALVTSEPEPEPGPNSDHRSRGWNPVTERREWERRWGGEDWLQPPERGRSQVSGPLAWSPVLYTEHKTRSSEPEKGNFTESSA